MDESDFEIVPVRVSKPSVAIDNKHADKKVVIKDPSVDPSGSKGLSADKPSPSSGVVVSEGRESDAKPDRDKINSLPQKEKAMSRVGLTRALPYQRIVEALEAVIEIKLRDKDGHEHITTTPDFERNKWGTEMALKAFGDLIERKEIEYDVGDKTLEKYKAMSVEQMKARMAELLLGRPVSRLPAIDVETESK